MNHSIEALRIKSTTAGSLSLPTALPVTTPHLFLSLSSQLDSRHTLHTLACFRVRRSQVSVQVDFELRLAGLDGFSVVFFDGLAGWLASARPSPLQENREVQNETQIALELSNKMQAVQQLVRMLFGSRQRAFLSLLATWIAWSLYRRRCYQRLLHLPNLQDRQRCCLVTGAASGIGLATARLLLSQGWHVGAFDVNHAGLRAAFGPSSNIDSNSVTIGVLDVTDQSSCKKAIATFLGATGGHLDVLFNCAGLLAVGPFAELNLNRQLAQVRVNVEGVVQLTHIALPALKTTVWFSVIPLVLIEMCL